MHFRHEHQLKQNLWERPGENGQNVYSIFKIHSFLPLHLIFFRIELEMAKYNWKYAYKFTYVYTVHACTCVCRDRAEQFQCLIESILQYMCVCLSIIIILFIFLVFSMRLLHKTWCVLSTIFVQYQLMLTRALLTITLHCAAVFPFVISQHRNN